MKQQSALFNLLKPPGMTSHDVVDHVRRLLGQRRVGHAGTLDPAATGVLVVMVGRATRLSRYVTNYDKRYRFELTFGLATDTGDADGEVIEQADASGLTVRQVKEAISDLKGILRMKPHRYSAAKVDGQKAYELARQGEEPELEERAVVIHEVTLLDFKSSERPRALFEVHCGKGTYVRSLAEVIGHRVGSCALASFVLRTQVGPFSVNDAVTLEELGQAAEEENLAELALPASVALSGYPRITVTPDQARLLVHGNPVPITGHHYVGELVAAYDADGNLVAMGEVLGQRPHVFQPRTVLAGGN
ncbi:MAG: tRNA pseudouridine(55) synthase TruB [Armatimonadetes bacterium]|nr:tRNA pseudouridine(55) synthase TruB [Armatimonadota bacterium]